jgi:hypothetical protein
LLTIGGTLVKHAKLWTTCLNLNLNKKWCEFHAHWTSLSKEYSN